ncbi:HIT family protein [Candidatus Woesearchaeota archaeon]|nr:MAG: HIT family protein [Candidatus Woesearchaeota archaeon]
MMEECLFCKIIRKEIPSKIIHEDDKVLAFLDISPVNKGHTLVIPKNHSIDLSEMSDDDVDACFKVARNLGNRMIEKLGADGYNINMNTKKAAGQIIFHSHIHIIPRFLGDGLELWHGKPYEESEIDGIHQKLKY